MTLKLHYQDWRRVLELKTKKTIAFIVSVIVNVAVTCAIVWYVSRSFIMFRGSDTMYHVYRGDWILKSVESGEIWPLYNPVWYNGVELMRYWPPVAAYLMAFCQFIARSLPSVFPADYVVEGYAIYCGVLYLTGAVAWNIAGFVKNRPVLGIFFGAMWFFMPQSLYVLFVEGNLPRCLIMAIFPLAYVFINEYLKKGKAGNFVGIAITFFVMCACHVGYTGMVVIACLIYVFIYRLCCFSGSTKLQPSGKRDIEVIAAMIAGFLLSGIFLLPALKGGLATNASNATQAGERYFQSLFITLNPGAKLNGGFEESYFGIVSFVLAVFGIITGKKRSRAGFITAIIIVLLTSKVAEPVIQSLPGGSLMWMMRFLQIAQAMILYSMLEWDSIKKPLLAVIVALLAADCALTAYAMRPKKGDADNRNFIEDMEANTLIDEAKSITDNRIAVIDSSKGLFNSTFYLTDHDGAVNQLFGQGWEAASTSLQIAQMNEAFDNGYYYFLFDRLMEFGCDTVLVKKDAASVVPYNEEAAETAAIARGYVKEYEEGRYVVFHHKDVTGTYGTVSKYDGLVIGNGAYYISMMFPSVAEAPSEYVDDFTLEELESYKVIYLDGFLYHDLHKAEDLITKASESGVKVYIMADGIPENKESRTYRFLDVECQAIEFDNGFPTLHMKDGEDIDVPLFPKENKKWKTVYVNGLKEELGWSVVLDERTPFYGTGSNENLTFIGFNLTYYYSITKDQSIGAILGDVYTTGENDLPERQVVPIDITYGRNSITIDSPDDDVNTSISDHDIFEGDYRAFNRLIHVDSGKTVITYGYPYLIQSTVMSASGLLLMTAVAVFIKKKDRRRDI